MPARRVTEERHSIGVALDCSSTMLLESGQSATTPPSATPNRQCLCKLWHCGGCYGYFNYLIGTFLNCTATSRGRHKMIRSRHKYPSSRHTFGSRHNFAQCFQQLCRRADLAPCFQQRKAVEKVVTIRPEVVTKAKEVVTKRVEVVPESAAYPNNSSGFNEARRACHDVTTSAPLKYIPRYSSCVRRFPCTSPRDLTKNRCWLLCVFCIANPEILRGSRRIFLQSYRVLL
jgi:hypothetical protein